MVFPSFLYLDFLQYHYEVEQKKLCSSKQDQICKGQIKYKIFEIQVNCCVGQNSGFWTQFLWSPVKWGFQGIVEGSPYN